MKPILLIAIYCITLTTSAQKLAFDRLESAGQVVQSIVYSPNGLMLAATDQQHIHVWHLNKTNSSVDLTGSFGPVMALAFASDNLHLLAAHGNSAKIWNIEDKQVKHAFDQPEGTILTVGFSPDNAYVALGGTDKTVNVWHVGTGELFASFKGHQKEINDLVFSLDGKYLITASSDKTIKVWDLKGKTLYKTLTGHKKLVKRLAISPDSVHVVSAGFDRKIFLWNIPDKTATNNKIKFKNPHSNWISGLDISANNYMVSVGHDNRIALYTLNLQNGKKQGSFYAEKMFNAIEKQPTAVRLNPASFQLAVATLGKGIFLDKYFQLNLKSPHVFRIRAINGVKARDVLTSASSTTRLSTTVTRPEEVKVLIVTNEKTKERKEYTKITAPEFLFEVPLTEKTNTFKVTIEDKDPAIPPVVYFFEVEASYIKPD